MQILSLVWGILAILGLGVAFIPCLGSLNWLNIPFAVVGMVVGFIANSQAPGGRSGTATAGIILNLIAIGLGLLRLAIGGGIL
jgi:hypothetical protein